MSKNDVRTVFRLHDSVIAGLARVLQQALVTRVDVTDILRTMRLEPMHGDEETLQLTDEYLKYEQNVLDKLVDQAEALMDKMRLDDSKNDDGSN